ncbi:hypothetical protein BT63DRAFT_215079 [Microthyrium microscopicum]|uniref:Uncharacterized protein n=1 Tax=Microthyrium microscopicum TaxID=703497 RepID=A0A6A6UI36_9PEZI|nr:hypothetical protein BT63DRAFT_215079 [Microthyrium microscopicum]
MLSANGAVVGTTLFQVVNSFHAASIYAWKLCASDTRGLLCGQQPAEQLSRVAFIRHQFAATSKTPNVDAQEIYKASGTCQRNAVAKWVTWSMTPSRTGLIHTSLFTWSTWHRANKSSIFQDLWMLFVTSPFYSFLRYCCQIPFWILFAPLNAVLGQSQCSAAQNLSCSFSPMYIAMSIGSQTKHI